VIGPFGPPSASIVGQITAKSSTASITTVVADYSSPNTVTGFVHRLPVDLPKPAKHQPDR
jgi:hypothetical protein